MKTHQHMCPIGQHAYGCDGAAGTAVPYERTCNGCMIDRGLTTTPCVKATL